MAAVPLDVSPGARLRRGFEDVVATIPGAEFFDVSARQDRRGEISVLLSFHGWSPTLHSLRIDLLSGLPADYDPSLSSEQLAYAVLQGMVTRLDLQKARAADARSMGADAPLRTGEISHLHVDAALASFSTRNGGDVRNKVRNAVGAMHAAHVASAGGSVLPHDRNATIAVEMPRENGTALRMVSIPHVVRGPKRRPSAYVETTPTIDALRIDVFADPLPDSVLSAVVGAPLGRFATMDPTLDGRTVRKAENAERDGAAVIRIAVDHHLQRLANA